MGLDLLYLVLGVLAAWWGGDIFVRGTVSLASWARWPQAVIGATVAAFGTSSPELLVGIQSTRMDVPALSLGDILGSNVVNVGLVLALALILSGEPMRVPMRTVRRDLIFVIMLPFLTAVMLLDGHISRTEGMVLLLLFAGWLLTSVQAAFAHARDAKTKEEDVEKDPIGKAVLLSLLGLGMLFVAAKLVVDGGIGVAEKLGWSKYIVGVIVVAIATSTPELATTLMARLRGHDDISLGNILGSNIFNGCLIVAVVAVLQPFDIGFREVGGTLVVGAATTILLWPGPARALGRSRGVVLLAIYVVYLIASVMTAGSMSH